MWRVARLSSCSTTASRLENALFRPATCLAPSVSHPIKSLVRGVYRNEPPRDLIGEVAAAPDLSKMEYRKFYDPLTSDYIFFIPPLYKQVRTSCKVRDFAFWSGEFLDHWTVYYENYYEYLYHSVYRLLHSVCYRLNKYHGVDLMGNAALSERILPYASPDIVKYPGMEDGSSDSDQFIRSDDGDAMAFELNDNQLDLGFKEMLDALTKGIDESPKNGDDHDYNVAVVKDYINQLSDALENLQRVERLVMSLKLITPHLLKKRLYEVHEQLDEMVFRKHNVKATQVCKAIINSGCRKAYFAEICTTGSHEYNRTMAYFSSQEEGEAFDRVTERFEVIRELMMETDIFESMTKEQEDKFHDLICEVIQITEKGKKVEFDEKMLDKSEMNDAQRKFARELAGVPVEEIKDLFSRLIHEFRPTIDAPLRKQIAFERLSRIFYGRSWTEIEHERYPGYRRMRNKHRIEVEENETFDEYDLEDKLKHIPHKDHAHYTECYKRVQEFFETVHKKIDHLSEGEKDAALTKFIDDAIKGKGEYMLSKEDLKVVYELDMIQEESQWFGEEDFRRALGFKTSKPRNQKGKPVTSEPSTDSARDTDETLSEVGQEDLPDTQSAASYNRFSTDGRLGSIFTYQDDDEELLEKLMGHDIGFPRHSQRFFDHAEKIGLPFFLDEVYINPDRKSSFMVQDSVKEQIWSAFHENPRVNTHWELAKRFNLRADRIDAILRLKHLEKVDHGHEEPFDIYETLDGIRFGIDWQKFMERWALPEKLPIDGIPVDFDGKPDHDYTSYKPIYDVDAPLPPEDGPGSGQVIEDKKVSHSKGQNRNRHAILISDLSDIHKSGKVNVAVRDKDGSLRHPNMKELQKAVMSERPLPRKVRERIRKEILARCRKPKA